MSILVMIDVLRQFSIALYRHIYYIYLSKFKTYSSHGNNMVGIVSFLKKKFLL